MVEHLTHDNKNVDSNLGIDSRREKEKITLNIFFALSLIFTYLFITLIIGGRVNDTTFFVVIKGPNKLECLPLASLSCLM